MNTHKAKLLATTVLGVATAIAAPAQAQMDPQTAARIEALENKIQDLEIKLGSQVEQAARKADEAQEAVKSVGKPEYDGTDFEYDSPDGKHHFEIGGRIMVDHAFYDDESDEGGRDFRDGTEFRRTRLFAEGTVFNVWKFKAQFDFSEDGDDNSEFKDVYLRYTGLDQANVTVGQFKKPFGLEELTSSKYITFMERNNPNEAIGGGGREIGLGIAHNGAFGEGGYSVAGGVFRGGGEANDEEFSLTGRVTVAPIAQKTMAVHLGGAINFTRSDEGFGDFSTETETHVDGFDPIDTGDFDQAESLISYGLEAAVVYGPFSLQGEYILTEVNDSIHANTPVGTDPTDFDFDGWYVFGSYFITGESRRYSASSGSFGRVSPNSVVGEGGYGALELAVRYSTIDLTDGVAVGGEADDITVGLNWYATKNIRFMFNWVNADVEDALETGTGDLDLNVFQARAQIDF